MPTRGSGFQKASKCWHPSTLEMAKLLRPEDMTDDNLQILEDAIQEEVRFAAAYIPPPSK